ncbi:MAG: Gmad2 immunoglobulin-like domain-containing protein [Burkholderiales bacterium]|nr:Gmad2 immunoglobulin-like domain-containing protein [Burkholderiales bacterium]
MDNKFFGSKLNSILLLILILLVLGVIYVMFQNKETYLSVFKPSLISNKNTEDVVNRAQEPLQFKDGIWGNKDDLISFSIMPYTKVHGVLSYRGVIKGGYFFEGNIGINILDINKKVLKNSNAIAKSEWMTAGPVDFEGNIDFTNLSKGSAYFEIKNDNPSDRRDLDKSILIPIVIE